ncbi:MAG TPA: hypothetical protein VNS32_16595, partial [Flavisolibacter sp.]|nr:hypothetical protein [Flavisolibacter sp.]
MKKQGALFYRLFICFSLFTSISATAQSIISRPYVVNGYVNTSLINGDNMYLGGNFSFVGPTTGRCGVL